MLKPPVCLFWPMLLRRPDFAFFAVHETADVGLVAVNENCADDSDRQADRRTELPSHVTAENIINRCENRDRKSVVKGKSVSVRVDLAGRHIIKKKQHKIIK